MALTTRPTLFEGIQSRLARTTASASALRGSSEGTARVVRRYLKRVRLEPFGTRDADVFGALLDRHTLSLAKRIPGPAPAGWGVARKMLNLFLRECAYNVYLRSAFNLGRSERLLELPLDALTGKAVLKESKRRESEWTGIRRLTPESSEVLQSEAQRIAKKKRLLRVHLDVVYWSVARDGK